MRNILYAVVGGIVDPVVEEDVVEEAVVAVVEGTPEEAENDVSQRSKAFRLAYSLSPTLSLALLSLSPIYLQHETVGVVEDLRPAWLSVWWAGTEFE